MSLKIFFPSTNTYMVRYPDKGWTVDSLKCKFKESHNKRVPTGDPQYPPTVHCAKRIRRAIVDKMDGSNLNSEGVDGGEESVVPPSDKSDKDDNLINSNDDDDDGKCGVGDAEEVDSTVGAEVGGRGSCLASRASGTIAGSVVDEGGEAAGTVRRKVPLCSSSSSRRHRFSTHLTPISRPRTQQQERSPDSPVTELAM